MKSSDPTRVGLKQVLADSADLYERNLRPHEGWSETTTQQATTLPNRLLRPHEGWSETAFRSIDVLRRGLLRPHEGWSETGERTRPTSICTSDPTRVGLKPCLKWRFQPLYQGVIG